MTPHLELRGVGWGPRFGAPVLSAVSLSLQKGRILGVIGPNGAGKSTLLRLIYRFLRPRTGQVLLDGVDIWAMDARAVACQIAAVLQEHPTDFALSVAEVVALGRAPHRHASPQSGRSEQAIVADALDQLALGPLAHRLMGTLSGGERQRVMVARALAQNPAILVLDEPTNHLDIRHQLEVIALIRDLGLTIVISLHDLNLAAHLCDDIVLLADGRVTALGPARNAMTPATLAAVFGVGVAVQHLHPSNAPHLTFHLTNS
ncbi:iron complex transport system ATP-binding protein [Pseudorhodobacter antarcticus]|jgi:iron complex transport system ATP-binding protein|uniref:Iron complex transport system ATP-binding protein n=1 Tax=Pseudorhodobacter antarcticus TaxID=1077947 RepID=A0A1H8GUT5_9RHOB|nr:ABC transporter ATP-binding protein [Pseudorhodobacter antarcticus]SEN47580.1 iron complex transport system ATP-binding protein [Pseudorhodobacter antarcticus]